MATLSDQKKIKNQRDYQVKKFKLMNGNDVIRCICCSSDGPVLVQTLGLFGVDRVEFANSAGREMAAVSRAAEN